MSARIERMVEMARSHIEMGGSQAAGAYYRILLKETSPPKSPIERLANGEACLWYARRALSQGRTGEACDWYQRGLQADPRAVDMRVEYVRRTLMPMNLMKNALIEAERCTKIDPRNREGWSLLGGVHHSLGNATEGAVAYDKAIELEPNNDDVKLDRCSLAIDMADYVTARKLATPIAFKGNGDAHHVLAMCNYREGNHELAINQFRAAVDKGCFDPALAEWNMSLAMHSIGDYKNGWYYHEARGRQKTDGPMRLIMNRFSVPIWQGEPNCRVHVHQEMGHGDTLAMARYIGSVVAAGCEVTVEVNESMVDLLQRSYPEVKVIPKAIDYPGGLGLGAFDYHVPMLSFPAIFETDIDTVPWPGPYLKPRPWAYPTTVRPRIGICWSSGIRNEGLWMAQYGKRKSLDKDHLHYLMMSLPEDYEYTSLQVGPERKWNAFFHDVLSEKPNWDETAALVNTLDLVITVDTSVAHLAGALGIPTWLMMHTEGSWHWMTKRNDSPWYPSVRLYRQERANEWGGVIDSICADLETEFALKRAG